MADSVEDQMEAEIDAVSDHIIKACEIYAAQTLFDFMAWFKDQCWPIEPKESKGAFDREEVTDQLINQFLAERRD